MTDLNPDAAREMARINAYADLAMVKPEGCTCTPAREVLRMEGDLITAIGETHFAPCQYAEADE